MLTSREVILVKLEATYQQDPGLSASDDAVLVEQPSWANEGARMIERAVTKPTFGKKQQVFGGSLKKISFSCEVKGSGTAGHAPEIGALLQACALGETVVADTSVTYAPVSTPSSHKSVTIGYYQDGMFRKLYGCRGTVSFSLEAGGKMMAAFEMTGHQVCAGTAQAGAATTITLASTSSAVDDTYNGQTVTVTSGTGAGQSAVITDYVGSTKVATVASWSVATPDNTSVYKISGGPIDAALVTPTYDSTVPVPLVAVPLSIGGYAAAITKLELSLGNTLAMPANVSAPDGFAEIRVTGRDIAGSFDPEATLVATKDWENEWESGQQQAIATGTIGTTAGNKISLSLPYAYYREIGPGDRDGIRTYEIGYAATESSGDDELQIVFQ
jgi:hypothetical protein